MKAIGAYSSSQPQLAQMDRSNSPIKPPPRVGFANPAVESVAEQVIYEEDDREELENYIHQYNQLQETKQRIFENPEIRKLIKDKQLQDKSLLSPFTIVENNFIGVTADHLLNQEDNKDGVGNDRIFSKRTMKEMLQKTNHDVKLALYQLSRLVDAGDFHIILVPDRSVTIELYAEIPRCFKLCLKDFEHPVVIQVKYHGVKAMSRPGAPAGEARDAGAADRRDMPSSIADADPAQPKNLADDTFAYGSFSCIEPTKQNSVIQLKQPRKIVVQEPSNEKFFRSKYFYLALESMKGTKITITACSNFG